MSPPTAITRSLGLARKFLAEHKEIVVKPLHGFAGGSVFRVGPDGANLASLIGFYLAFMPLYLLGFLGMPRRYHAYPDEFQVLHVLSTAGASVLALGLGLPIFYLLYSLWRGADAGKNPWGGTTLEWDAPTPPTTFNFAEPPARLLNFS